MRTESRKPHPHPNWVFLKGEPITRVAPRVIGLEGYWPENVERVSMANSFGVPSLEPAEWQKDVREASKMIRVDHQVLIVSIIASLEDKEDFDIDTIADDFVRAASMAVDAGAMIVEANYSCPNTPDEWDSELYQFPERAAEVSEKLRHELDKTGTPLFVKIGYLPKDKLREFFRLNHEHVHGITAINTKKTTVVDDRRDDTFPLSEKGRRREKAGVSGWAIKEQAQEVAKNLVQIRKEAGLDQGEKKLTLIGVGGVLTPKDFYDFLEIGVDAVGSCTGAFLDPHLGLKVRFDSDADKRHTNRLLFELRLSAEYFRHLAFHPKENTIIEADDFNKEFHVVRR